MCSVLSVPTHRVVNARNKLAPVLHFWLRLPAPSLVGTKLQLVPSQALC